MARITKHECTFLKKKKKVYKLFLFLFILHHRVAVLEVTLIGKTIFQELWKTRQGWDEPVTGKLLQDWQKFSNDVSPEKKLAFQDGSSKDRRVKLQVHGFCDAFTKAYGAAVYTRVVDEKGRVHVHSHCYRHSHCHTM